MGSISFSSSTAAIGLDIGTDHVRIAQVKPAGAGLELTGYGSVEIPMGAVVEGEIVDVEAVTSAIKELQRRSNVRGKNVAIGVANQKVIVRLIDLPFMERAELEGAIQYQAQDYIPMAVEESILDFQIIGDYMTPGDEHMMEVLLVAAHRDMIANAVAAVEGAGLKLTQIDVSSFALVRALMGSGQPVIAQDDEGSAVGVIHISSGITNITVVERGVPRFNRISSLAGNQFTQAIANVLNLTFDEAESLKVQVGLPDVESGTSDVPEGLDPSLVQPVQDSLEREVNKFIAEVRRSLDYYLTQTAQVRTIQRIILTGSGAQLKNLAGYLEKGLQAKVEVGDPFVFVKATGATQQLVGEDRSGSAVAIGLAMGGLQS
ncbi:MAG: type IV pilus assembly protein PilM [Coriobacteriia bacterium]|nr:type IV pilus assembly protein PilM [Coriobacteriia bacterium]MBN2822641.1 type IV pilus assembly protein PilM [Coriobacteriia bacterium]